MKYRDSVSYMREDAQYAAFDAEFEREARKDKRHHPDHAAEIHRSYHRLREILRLQAQRADEIIWRGMMGGRERP